MTQQDIILVNIALNADHINTYINYPSKTSRKDIFIKI
jgi:hypothetical protein